MSDTQESATSTEPTEPAVDAAPSLGLESVLSDDPRVIMAAERTLLAWVRTGLALMGFGFLVAKFGLFTQELVAMRNLTPIESPAWSTWIGAGLVLLGVIVNVLAAQQHLRYLRQVGGISRHFRGGSRLGIFCAISLGVLGALMVLRLLLL